ncbi:MAG: tRNA 2-thiouridine(34) synthase MnmA [Clostridia bacterium]|nr:tRNA 2-thiouridine(34) synthase MnmA [Clostridia bacterium]
MKKVLVAMSGGVDSSVTALLVKQKGYECIGATMHLFDKGEGNSQDEIDAKKVADKLGISHIILDYTDEFKKQVIERFIRAYEEGETPNPCLVCNKYLKFGSMIDYLQEAGYDYIATGHYARIEEKDGRFLLKKAADLSKDQSYMLYSLSQNQLSHTLFPLGNISKEKAREIAEENDLTNARKKDSQDICFVPNGDYAGVISSLTGKSYPKGDFVSADGKVLGKHKGIINYTIGQRKGLGLALPRPLYVKEKDVEGNRVVLCEDSELFENELTAKEFNWIAFDKPKKPIRAYAKIRYKHTEQPATVTVLENNDVKIVFDTPQRAISKGQAVVLYDGDIVIGGGIIK